MGGVFYIPMVDVGNPKYNEYGVESNPGGARFSPSIVGTGKT